VIRVGVVGLGKMGLSHHALFNAHPEVELAGLCDSSGYVLGVMKRYTDVATYGDYGEMLERAGLDAVVIATPTRSHAGMIEAALERGLHVFCEKPLTLDPRDAERLARLGEERGAATQVGYHNRFVAAFGEVKSLLEAGAIGDVTHVFGEAYGPVVLKPKGKTWRSSSVEGGGCLYDYAAHVINLVNWYVGEPLGVGGTVLPRFFSRETDDGAFGTLYFDGGRTGQISVNWSDESYRKMTTRINVWGTAGRIFADRQECQAYLRDGALAPAGYEQGWNVRYTTDLTAPVWFYLRGEEYSAQVEAFVEKAGSASVEGANDFASAAVTDRTIAMMVADAQGGPATRSTSANGASPAARPARRRWWRRERSAA
jgi:scyllo-inositol 2-dehydrogenase (NADP+)